jgi:hypothetical protein
MDVLIDSNGRVILFYGPAFQVMSARELILFAANEYAIRDPLGTLPHIFRPPSERVLTTLLKDRSDERP